MESNNQAPFQFSPSSQPGPNANQASNVIYLRRFNMYCLSMTFTVILTIGELISFISGCATGNPAVIVISLLLIGCLAFVFVCLRCEYETWLKLRCWLKAYIITVSVLWGIALLIIIIVCGVGISNSSKKVDKDMYTAVLIACIIILIISYGFYAGALFPAYHLYEPVQMCDVPASGGIIRAVYIQENRYPNSIAPPPYQQQAYMQQPPQRQYPGPYSGPMIYPPGMAPPSYTPNANPVGPGYPNPNPIPMGVPMQAPNPISSPANPSGPLPLSGGPEPMKEKTAA